MANGAAWAKLQAHYDETMQSSQMRDLFASDPARFEKFSATFHDILLDYSKNIVTDETMALLEQMCVEAKVLPMAKAMFSGEMINLTEKRAVLHVALRNRSNTPIMVDGKDVMPEVNEVLTKLEVRSAGDESSPQADESACLASPRCTAARRCHAFEAASCLLMPRV